MQRRLVATGSVVLGVGLAAWFAHGEYLAQRKRTDVVSAKLALVEARLDAERPVERVIERHVPVEVSRQTEEPRPAVATDPGEATEVSEGEGLTDEEMGIAYAEDFAREPVDPRWAREAERSFLDPIRRALPQSSRLLSFECHSKFCRAQFVHESPAVSNAFLMDLFGLSNQGALLESAQGFRADDPVPTRDGKYSVNVYIAGKGVAVAIDS